MKGASQERASRDLPASAPAAQLSPKEARGDRPSLRRSLLNGAASVPSKLADGNYFEVLRDSVLRRSLPTFRNERTLESGPFDCSERVTL